MADKITKRTLSRKRILGSTILLLIPFIILLLRLYQVQIIEGLVHRNQTDRQAIKYVITPPVRGQIYSADGKILAGNKSHYDLTMNPSQMRSRSGYIYTSSYMLNTATFIQNNLVNRTHNLNIKSLRKRMQLDMAQPIVLYKDLTEEEITRVAEFSPPIKGLDISQRIERDYPLPGVASHILGYTTWKNRTQKFNNSKNKFSTFTSKELLGNSGLEYLYDKELSGYPGIKNVLMDPLGFVVKELPGSTYPVNGFDLVLTIDSKAQAAADNALKGHTGAIVAINPQNGAILAIASSPTYDLSQLTPKLLAEMSNDNVGRPTYNRATAGTYMPGSIVKPLVALAALEHGDISFDTTCDCKGYIYVGGRQVRCAKRDGHGVLNLSDAIVVSCNPYFIQTGMTCKLKVLQPMFEAAGFGSKTGCFDPLVKYLGTLPSAETAFRIRRRNWTASDTALASIGQGLIQLSPLQAALYTAALWEVVGAGTLPQGVTHIVGGLAKAPNRYYACFGREGVYASTDGGEHWEHKPGDFPAGMPMRMLAMDPRNPLTVHLIAKSGHYVTYDGGDSWLPCRLYERDYVYNPTLPEEPWGRRKSGLVTEASGIALSPVNPDHILIAANWNNVVSRDGGISWVESAKGADISCIHDVRFAGDSVYAVAMDEGLLRSDDNGATWKALYPKRWAAGVSGHQWRVLPQVLADGSVRIVSTLSAWKHGSAEFPNAVLISRDGGHSFEKTTAGLPSRRPKHHTMWEEGYARALCADPSHLDTLYLGIDGKASPEDPQSVDGGIFKSTNGGKMWKRLPQQPESLQSFYGLAVDPTDSKRIFWGTCGEKSGVYRSLDGGESWQKTSLSDGIFSLEIMPSGTILAGGKFLWMSRDHGETWTQASTLKNVTVCGLAFDPENEQRLWIAGNRWGTSAGEGVWESTDGGTTWRDITADLPNTRPNNLRYNPRTRELWAVGPAAFRIQR